MVRKSIESIAQSDLLEPGTQQAIRNLLQEGSTSTRSREVSYFYDLQRRGVSDEQMLAVQKAIALDIKDGLMKEGTGSALYQQVGKLVDNLWEMTYQARAFNWDLYWD
jgi:hypothetical protein